VQPAPSGTGESRHEAIDAGECVSAKAVKPTGLCNTALLSLGELRRLAKD
jgi:hypothetical protein